MNRVIKWALVLAMIVVVAGFAILRSQREQSGIQIERRYVLVSVAADPEWQSSHTVHAEWKNGKIELPFVIRLDGIDTRELGANDESSNSITIGDRSMVFSVNPSVSVRISNEPAFLLIRESGRNSRLLSTATWVSISPLSETKRFDPANPSESLMHNSGTLRSEILSAIANGKIVDISPGE